MKVLITESQITNIIEAYKDSLSVHLDRKNLTGLDVSRKYYSDSIVQMQNRHTGHFGSGTYFSTFKTENPEIYEKIKQTADTPSQNNPVVNISNSIYMIDLDLYHLYKPRNKNHAELLFNTLKKINSLASIHDLHNINLSDPDTKRLIVEIGYNLKFLDLKAPSLKEFVNLFNSIRQKYRIGTLEHYGSLSTRFMEYNGYNGVNVNNIPGFDNTLHGSVVYDLENTISGQSDQPNKYKLEFEVESEAQINSIVKLLEDKNILIKDIREFSLDKINLIFNLLSEFVPLEYFKYSEESNKITERQYNHIEYNIYPKYIKRLFNLNKIKFANIEDSYTIIAIFMSGIPFIKIEEYEFTTGILKILYNNIYKFDSVSLNTLKDFKLKEYISLVKEKHSEDEDIQMYIEDVEVFI